MRVASFRTMGFGAAILLTALLGRAWSQDDPPPVPEPPGETAAEAELPPEALPPEAPAPKGEPAVPSEEPAPPEKPAVPPKPPVPPTPKPAAEPEPENPPPAKPAPAKPAPVEPAPGEPAPGEPVPETAPPATAPVPENLSPAERRGLDNWAARMQSALSVDPTLQGGVLSGYRISRINDNARLLELEYQSDVNYAADVERLARQELIADSYWAKANPPITEVRVISQRHAPVNPERLARYVRIARNSFRHCDLSTARTSFQLALQEAPDALTRDVINFWCVACDIGLGQTDLAERRLTWLLDAYPLGASTPVIAHSMESIQGPLRLEMDRMERGVLLGRAFRGNSLDNTAPQNPAVVPSTIQPYEDVPRRQVPPAPPQPTSPPIPKPVTLK